MLTLDWKGTMSALLLGIAVFILGGSMGGFFLIVLLWLLMISAVVTRFKKRKKVKLGVYQSHRGWKNVAANGIVPLLAVLMYYLNSLSRFIDPRILVVAYVASVAAVAADKFSSEIGVLGREPIMLLTLRKVRRGTSGGVSSLGTLSGILASFLIGLVLIGSYDMYLYIAAVVVSGTLGNIIDSFFGFYEEKGYGSKYLSNAVCSLAGWLACVLLLYIF